MKSIFIDTNIMLDYLLDREGSLEAEQILALSQLPNYIVMMSTLSMSNIAYITRHVFQGEALYNELEAIRELVHLTSVDENHVDEAINLRAVDFEDSLQYVSAKSANADVIVTKNKKHFQFVDMTILTPTEFLSDLEGYTL